MTPERWREIDELYQAALALPPADRAALLEAKPELRGKVESMLAQPSGGGLLDRPAGEWMSESQETQLAAGTLLGPYKIEALLGAGGMGQVFRAMDTRLGRKVAVKVAHDQFSARFSREAQAISTLNHPHICTLYDVGPNYLVMELVEGETLAAKLQKGALSIEQTLRYGAQIAEALAEAHAKGIVHRDLKPANIMIAKAGVKVLDFGLAKSTTDQSLTAGDAVMGTPAYLAPEQIEGKPADARTDIYGFGLVLYEMAAGKRPAQPPALDGLPDRFGHVLERCLAPEPESRWQSANDVQAELQWAAKIQPATIMAKPSRRWPWVAAATVLLGVLAGLFAWQSRRPSEQLAYRLQLELPEGGRFVFGAGPDGGVALSPDGKTAAYVVERDKKQELWIRPLDGANARPLAGTDGARDPFWSPDNRSVAFFSGTKLLRVDLTGGAPVPIDDLPSIGQGGAWSEDGRIIFGTVTTGLLQVPASGGKATPLTSLDSSRGEVSHWWPRALPGGRFLYSVFSARQETMGVFVASLAKPAERTEVIGTLENAQFSSFDGKDYLLWLRGPAVVAQRFDLSTLKLVAEPQVVAGPVAWGFPGYMYLASSGGVLLYASPPPLRRLRWLDHSGKPLEEAGEPGILGFRISPEGSRVALARINDAEGVDLWVLEAARGVSNRLTSNPGFSQLPVWSPDGRRIVFSYGHGSPANLYLREASGAGTQQQLTEGRKMRIALDWSRDGRFILYFDLAEETWQDLWVLPMTPEGKPAGDPKPYLRTRFAEVLGRFEPRTPPRWVAYQSNESGRDEVYVQSFPEPRGARRISTAGGQYPQWNANGRELFYVSPDNKLMAVSLRVQADSVEPSPPHELFSLPSQPWSLLSNPYDAAPDGQRFLVQGPDEQSWPPLTVIVNWPALLKKGPATQ